MKKSKILLSLILSLLMLTSSFSALAVDTTELPDVVTTAVSDEELSDDYWNGYDDGYMDGYNDGQSGDYDLGYEDGYYDGSYDGYEDGYYEGFYDGVNAYKEPTIFEKFDNFNSELIYRIKDLIYRIRDLFDRIFRLGDYAPLNPVDPEADFIPDGTQATLAGDEEAEALCFEFNELIYNFTEVITEPISVTKNVKVGATVTDVPAFMKGTVNGLLEQFLMDDSVTYDFEPGDYAYCVQQAELYPEGLVEATKTVNADGTTDYKFVLIEEASYFDGYSTSGVKYENGEFCYGQNIYHDYVADTIYVEVADLDPITVSSAEIVYPGATITAKTDAEGRLLTYDINMPVKGKGTAKVMGISLSARLEGYRNEGFVIAYGE